MKNLELMGVQELNAVEMKNENGGLLPLVAVCILIGVGCAIHAYYEFTK